MFNEEKCTTTLRAGSNIADGEPVTLTDLELEFVLGGSQMYDLHPSDQTNPTGNALDLKSHGQQEQYGPPAPPLSAGLDAPLGGGLPPGAPGIVQPHNGRALAEGLADAASYYGRQAAAEALDAVASWAPFPFNYVLDKGSDIVRPDAPTYGEYAEDH